MENNQNQQQHSAASSDSKLTDSRQHQGQRHNLNLVELIKRCPWLVWAGVLVFLYITTAISISSLFQAPTDSVVQQPESTSVTADNPTELSPTPSPRNLLHLWLLGAVAFSFVTGSLIIAKRLKVKYSATRVPTRRQLRRRRLKKQLPQVPTTLKLSPPVASSISTDIEHKVTVPPPEEKYLVAAGIESSTEATLPSLETSHPADSGEISLAEMMDIRKHLPLSVILGDCDRFRSHKYELKDEPVET